jgi:hypothetical protein
MIAKATNRMAHARPKRSLGGAAVVVAGLASASCSSCAGGRGPLDASDSGVITDVVHADVRDGAAAPDAAEDASCGRPSPPVGWSRLPLPCDCDFLIAGDI